MSSLVLSPSNALMFYDALARPVGGKKTPAHLMIYAAARRAGNRPLWLAMMRVG